MAYKSDISKGKAIEGAVEGALMSSLVLILTKYIPNMDTATATAVVVVGASLIMGLERFIRNWQKHK